MRKTFLVFLYIKNQIDKMADSYLETLRKQIKVAIDKITDVILTLALGTENKENDNKTTDDTAKSDTQK